MDTKAKQSLLKKLNSSLRRIVRNSYLNEKYNYRLKPALPLLWLAIALQPARARQTGSYFRHLPGPKSKMDILLDIGCANGHFLQIARDELGYQVEGLEIDPHAREIAQSRGLKIHAGQMPGSGLSPGSYAQITLSHVLEHLHDPLAALQECRDLLHPGGRIWLCIPNLAATSLGRFGIYSFLLDPPRHLVMFDSRSLSSLLAKAGFQNIQLQSEPGHDFMFIQSWMVEQGMDPYATPFSVVPAAIKHELIAKYRSKPGVSEYSEIITMTATKPL
jgi:2-polyprenyl-3-methyl-5-hydroxy-6-metoxy-1,4-benzoquinol methylase